MEKKVDHEQAISGWLKMGSRLFGATISARPFRDHLFRCRSFSAQIVSAPIRCSLTVQLFRVKVRVRVWVRISQKAPNIGIEKVRAEMVVPKWLRRKVEDPAGDGVNMWFRGVYRF